MKKSIKKLLTMACALVLCILTFTGCSWLKIDNYKYYNQVVASISSSEKVIKEFNKFELIDAFNQYGYQYYQQYGMSLKDSVNSTIDSMIDKYVLLEEVKKEIEVSPEEELEIKQEVFNYMQDSIFTYEEKIRKEWGIEQIESEEHVHEDGHDHSHEEESLRDAQNEYTPTIEYNVVEKTKDDNSKYIDYELYRYSATEPAIVVSVTKDDHFGKSFQVITDTKVSNEAWSRYVKSLQNSAKNEGRSTKESEVLLHEEKRLFNLMLNNLYLEKFENEYFENMPVFTQEVLDYFRVQFKAQQEKYSDKNNYHTAMKDASKNMFYYHANSGAEYVNVKHILVNFDDTTKKKIELLNAEYDITDDGSAEDEERKKNTDYQNRLNSITRKTKSTFELDGKVMTEDIDWIVDYVYNAVESKTTFVEKSKTFNDLIYVFNDDPGIMNSEFDYVVNLDTSVQDQMVKPFADGARYLALGKLDENGVVIEKAPGEGSMIVVNSTYGVHIIFNDGVARNIVNEKNIDNVSDADLLRILLTTNTRPDSNKSIFNYIYDTLKLDENLYNNMTQTKVNTIKTQMKADDIKITLYVNNYKDLYDK